MAFNGKVLLVDDEAHIRKYVGLMLKQLGQPLIVEASNGDDGIAAFKQHKPDLVILDINMLGMDGISTLQELRKIDPDCAVIMLTSLAKRSAVDEALNLGAVNYLLKDMPRDELSRALADTINDLFPPETPETPIPETKSP